MRDGSVLPSQICGHAEIIRDIWYEDTASPRCARPWNPDNPAMGQSDVTALPVQKLLGGQVRRYFVDGDHDYHYYNVLEDGTEIDLAHGELPDSASVVGGVTIDVGRLLDLSETDLSARLRKLSERYDLSLLARNLGC
jgi:hypothetical protein